MRTASTVRLSGLLTVAVALSAPAAPAQQPADSAAGDRREGGREARDPPLVTDRPDFTESTASVGAGRVQVEAGYTISRQDGTDEHVVGEVLARVGLTRSLELRVAPGSYVVERRPGGSTAGLADPSLGAKATLVEARPGASGGVPAVAVLASSSLPAGHDALNPDGAQPSAGLAVGWDLGAGASLGANLRHTRRLAGGERFGQTVASAALGLSATSRAGVYLEYYTLRPAAPGSGDADVLDGGVTLLLGPDAQLDARVGAGLGSAGPDLIFGIGFAVRR